MKTISKKKLQNLVSQSYKGGQLDSETVNLLADHMNRQTLKQYINSIKQQEKKKQVTITSPRALQDADKKELEKLFPHKKIMYILDPEMINGIQITDNDQEFEVNLNRTFNDIMNHLSEYD